MSCENLNPDVRERGQIGSVEFGLKFTGKGGVIVASGSAKVALKVVIGYEAVARRRSVATDEEPENGDPV